MIKTDLKHIALKDTEFCVLDVETTGLSAKNNRVIEIGIVKIKNFRITEKFSSLINPGVSIPYHITNITGISTSDVIDKPPFEFLLPDITDFVGNAVIAAHNLPFDESFMKEEYLRCSSVMPENPSVCTLRLARKMYPELKSRSLGSLTQFFRVRHKDVHRALGDAMVTAKIFIKMMDVLMNEYSIESVAELINFQHLPSRNAPGYRLVKKRLAEDMQDLPDRPGVYFFYNKSDEVIYIGKAKSLKKRVNNYFSSNPAKKPKQIVRKASRFGFEETNSELTALLTEAELIKKHRPVMNTLLKKYSLNHFIKIEKEKPYPVPKPTGKFDFDGNDYFGPYNGRATVQLLVDIINKSFAIRECTEKEFKKKKRCYLADIQRCVAPCEANADPEDYSDELGRVYRFLSGDHQDAVNRLLGKMKLYSQEQKYEEAAKIRDTVNLILKQLNKSSIISEPVNSANVLIKVAGEKDDFLLLIGGRVYIRSGGEERVKEFDTALEDYYAGTAYLFNGVEKRDLEQIKIILSWLIKNRTRAGIYYLKNYSSYGELFGDAKIGLKKK